MHLYRVTLSNTQSITPAGKSVKRRTYRWGDMWGTLTGSEWLVERRITITTSPLLEAVERLVIQSPPPHVEDIWEEEVILLEDGAEWNGLVSFSGSGSDVTSWCKKRDISIQPLECRPSNKQKQIPHVQVESLHTRHTQSTYTQSTHTQSTRSRCLISDDV